MTMELLKADAEHVFSIRHCCWESSRNPGISFPFSPTPGRVVVTDGRLMVCVWSDCYLPPVGKIPDIEPFEKIIREQSYWTVIEEMEANAVHCDECQDKGKVFTQIIGWNEGQAEFEELSIYRAMDCECCEFRIGQSLFSKLLLAKVKFALPGITHFAIVENSALFKSPFGWAVLMKKLDHKDRTA